MSYTAEQYQTALAKAQAAGDTEAVSVIKSAMQQVQPTIRHDLPSLGQLQTAFWNAKAAKDEPAAQVIFREVRRQGSDVGEMPEFIRQQALDESAGEMGAGEQFVAGVGAQLPSIARGFGQLANRAARYTTPVGLLASDALDSGYQQSQLAEEEQRAMDAPLNRTGWGFFGGVAGQVAPYAAAGIAASGTKAAAALLPRTLPGAIAEGTAMGAAQPLATGETGLTRARNVALGGAGGVAGNIVPRVISSGARAGQRILPNFSQGSRERQAAEVIESFAQNPQRVRQALEHTPNAGVIIPGSQPTLAEMSGDVGLYGLQRSMQSASPDFNNAVTVRGLNNNTSRLDYLRKHFLGADETAAQAVEKARDKIALPLIEQAKRADGVATERVIRFANSIIKDRSGRTAVTGPIAEVRNKLIQDVTPTVRLSTARGFLQSTIDAGKRMSSSDFDALTDARRIVISAQRGGTQPEDAASALKAIKPESKAAQQAIAGARNLLVNSSEPIRDVHRLYNARQHINDMLSRKAGSESDAAKAAARELITLRSVLDGQMRKASPHYGEFLNTYRAMSRPADQIRIGEELVSRGSNIRDSGGNIILSPDKFAGAARDLDAVAQKATGFKKARADAILTPRQKLAIAEVRSDLERFANVGRIGKSVGSDTVQKAVGSGRVQEMTGPIAAGVLTGEPTSAIALAGLNGLRKKYGEETFRIVSDAMADPVRAAEILAKLHPQTRRSIVREFAPMIGAAFAIKAPGYFNESSQDPRTGK